MIIGVPEHSSLTRRVLSLALPALGALIAQPIFVLVDSAMVGHLGSEPLAGLGLASTLLQTIVYLFVFLLFSTTTQTARAFGRQDIPSALTTGIQATYLALFIGLGLAAATFWGADWLLSFFTTSPEVLPHARAYLQASSPGIVGMFVVMGATGTLRGLHDTRSAFIVSATGAVINVGLNAFFIYSLGWGVAGSGIGTSMTELLMAGALLWAMFRRAQIVHAGFNAPGTAAPLISLVSLRPSLDGVRTSFQQGFWLLIRTAALRIALMAITAAATGFGVTVLAAHHIVWTLWGFVSYALDSLAIAGQTLFAAALGTAASAKAPPSPEDSATPSPEDSATTSPEDSVASLSASSGGVASHGSLSADEAVADPSSEPSELLRVLTRWGAGCGAVLGVFLAATSTLMPVFFTTDSQVRSLVSLGLLCVAPAMPFLGVVYLYDGIMMGANHTRYLAVWGTLVLLIHIPALLWISSAAASWPASWAMAALWLEICWVFMLGRAAYLWFGVRRIFTT